MGKLGTAIREQRKKRKTKVYELARTIGVHPTYITYIEKHNRLPSLEIIVKLEKALGINLQEFYFKEKHPAISSLIGSTKQQQQPDIIWYSGKDAIYVIEAKSPAKEFLSELNHFLGSPKKEQDSHKFVVRFLIKFAPNQQDSRRLVNELTQRVESLRKESLGFGEKQTSRIKDILDLIPSAEPKS